MESGFGLFDGQYQNITGQEVVEREFQAFDAERRVDVKVRDITPGRDAGIRAAASIDRDLLLEDFADRGLDLALDGWNTGLVLPARVVRAVEFDGQLQVTQGKWRSQKGK
jgi:hypothetical protein